MHSAAISSYGFGDTDLLTRVTTALRLYPLHGAVEVAAAAAVGDLPKWTVILESLDVADYTQQDALAKLPTYDHLNAETGLFLSDDYGSLNPGFWVIYAGMFDARDDAAALCSSIRGSVDFCYERYLQDLPTTTGANGACGPYGRFNVVGISSGRLSVYVGPSTAQEILSTYGASETGILSAGTSINVGSTSWTPVETNGKIGWVESRDLAADSTCAGSTPPPPSTTSCPAVAVATADLLQSIVSAAGAGDVSGIAAVSSIDTGVFDTQATSLVSDAGANRCDVAELNDLVAAQYGAIKADGQFAELVRERLPRQSFFAEG